MASNQLKPEPNLDQRKSALNNNPCGICRAMGSPTCKGHGGSGGGSGGSSDKNESLTNVQATTNKPISIDLEKSLGKSTLWLKPDDLAFEFNIPDALISVKIDMEQGVILFSGKGDLSPDQNIALQKVFEAIKQEFNEFKKDFSVAANQMQLNQVGNELKVTISNPKLFDAFVQRLLDKNILTTEMGPMPSKGQNTVFESKQETGNQYKSPNPSDISGPKPWK
ncbi:hypothetical protein [Legionella fallonii]|uniref:Uncharacterized protein n=1 Tax=Legionella fallonii LLAP-10 TaxID=1212491 RepID=A0A098G770_9GAMM|nr:hypothetical protein [Legionella fallonii]CEG57846.1 conserved protein of unknown function [Legionella fallonii LLAP-10]